MDVNLGTTANGCTIGHPTNEFNGVGSGTDSGGTLARTFQPIANCTGVDANNRGTSSGENFSVIERATISGATPAATDYSDIVTIVAAGNF
jgi:hypothetical protein